MQYLSLIARASLSYAPWQLKANARSVTTTLPYPNSRSLKSRIVAIRRSHPVAASLSTSLPNGRVRTEIKSDEKPIIVIDNYDSFIYNLYQDEAKSMQQSEHEDVVMEARVRGPSWFSFGDPYSRCIFSLGRKNPPPCTFMGCLMFSRYSAGREVLLSEAILVEGPWISSRNQIHSLDGGMTQASPPL